MYKEIQLVKLLICSILFLNVTVNSDVISELQVSKCRLGDDACLKKSTQDALKKFASGLPQYGVQVLDVLDVGNIDINAGNLKFTLKNAKLKGLKNAVIDIVKVNLKKKTIILGYHADFSMKGKYTADGRILILPITGDGDIKIKLKNFSAKIVINFEWKMVDGKKYIHLLDYKYDYDIKEGAHFAMTNLFNGNKELSDATLTFMNQNWKEVANEFGRPIMDVASRKMFDGVAIYLNKNAVEDIAIA